MVFLLGLLIKFLLVQGGKEKNLYMVYVLVRSPINHEEVEHVLCGIASKSEKHSSTWLLVTSLILKFD